MNIFVCLFMCICICCTGCIIVLGTEIHDLKDKIQKITNDLKYKIEKLEDKVREIDN